VEADLDRYYHRDLGDRWRFGPDGRRLLTFRMIRARVRHLPPDSATGQALGLDTGWKVGDYLLSDVVHALTGKPHPARPKPSRNKGRKVPDRRRLEKLAAAKRRKAAREAKIAAGEL
jgi:hypothetical protein